MSHEIQTVKMMRAVAVAQVVEHLPSKREVMSQIPVCVGRSMYILFPETDRNE
jgi:hypothetical protein